MFLPLHPDTGAPFLEERAVAVREEPCLHFEFFQRDVADGMRSSWKTYRCGLKSFLDQGLFPRFPTCTDCLVTDFFFP